MKKKLILLALTIFLLNIVAVSELTTASSLENNNNFSIDDLFKVNSTLQIDVDDESSSDGIVISPGSSKEVNLTIKYKLNLRPFLNRFLLNTKIGNIILFKNSKFDSQMKITVEAIGGSSWCKVNVKTPKVKLDINNEFCEVKASVVASVYADAEAFKTCEVKIQAYTLEGDWKIKHSYAETTLTIISGCNLDILVSSGKLLNFLDPDEESSIPIRISNWGNAEAIVDVEIENQPESWDISLDSEKSLTIPVGGNGWAHVTVKSKKATEDKTETIKIKFTPRASTTLDIDDNYLMGPSKYFKIKLKSYVYDGDETSQHTPGFEILSLIIAAGVVFLALKRIKK